MKYMLENPVKGKIGEQKYKTSITWRQGEFITDEPEKLGGQDLGPDPYTLLLSSLVGCTLATLRMYIDHKGLSISEIEVEANLYFKIVQQEPITYIERRIIIQEEADPQILERLLQIAENCPISKILKGKVNVLTEFKG